MNKRPSEEQTGLSSKRLRFPNRSKGCIKTIFGSYHIISSVFGDYSQQVIQAPPAHTQEPQVFDTVPSLFDESNDLISFLDHFETGLAREQQEIPMDLTMPRLKKK
ncbi:hypothetical protein TNCV_3359041 [Trichonephila clavipes]|nr:hypothetical protein TNCV_3359041 [Trichonephila clavipes]